VPQPQDAREADDAAIDGKAAALALAREAIHAAKHVDPDPDDEAWDAYQ
jgi:hypothetical protein